MSMKKRNRSNRSRSLRVESLERREVLAGNVTAMLVGSTLVINGDGADNQVAVISLGNSRYAVAGVNTTINGRAGTFTTPRATMSINADLKGGNDAIGFSNNADALGDLAFDNFGVNLANLGIDVAALQTQINALTNVTKFTLTGNISVIGAAGNDLIGIVGDVGGSITANLGAAADNGFNAFGIDGSSLAANGTVGGVVSVLGDRQSDGVAVISTDVRGGVSSNLRDGDNGLDVFDALVVGSITYSGGNGNDFVQVEDSTVVGVVSAVLGEGAFNDFAAYDSILGGVSVLGGSGQEFVDTANVEVKTNVIVSTFAGNDDINLHEHGAGSTDVAGLISVDSGSGDDFVEVSGESGSLSVLTGDGLDEVVVYDSMFKYNVTVNTGNHNDDVTMDNVEIGGMLTVLLGEGNDVVDVDGLVVGLNALLDAGGGDDVATIVDADIAYTFTALMGAGNDTLNITTSSAMTAMLDGGAGALDELNADAASIAAVDNLFANGFEL